MTASGELRKYRKALLARLERERRAWTRAEHDEMRALWEAADAARSGPISSGGAVAAAVPVPSWADILMEFGPAPEVESPEPEPVRAAPPARKRMGRRPKPAMSIAAARRLEPLVARRVANRHGPRPTQEQLAERFKVDRHVIQRAEALVRARWPLPESDPDFRAIAATDGFVYWPTVTKARQLLARARSERPTG